MAGRKRDRSLVLAGAAAVVLLMVALVLTVRNMEVLVVQEPKLETSKPSTPEAPVPPPEAMPAPPQAPLASGKDSVKWLSEQEFRSSSPTDTDPKTKGQPAYSGPNPDPFIRFLKANTRFDSLRRTYGTPTLRNWNEYVLAVDSVALELLARKGNLGFNEGYFANVRKNPEKVQYYKDRMNTRRAAAQESYERVVRDYLGAVGDNDPMQGNGSAHFNALMVSARATLLEYEQIMDILEKGGRKR